MSFGFHSWTRRWPCAHGRHSTSTICCSSPKASTTETAHSRVAAISYARAVLPYASVRGPNGHTSRIASGIAMVLPRPAYRSIGTSVPDIRRTA
eukprot:1664009-Rhodomonas_salina.2